MADPINTAAAVDAYLDSPARLGAQARMTMTDVVGTKPDYEAELRSVAQKTGVPVDTVRAYPDEMKKQATLGAYDFDQLAEQFPNTTKFLANPDRAAVGHDDTDVLSSLESTAKFLVSAPGTERNLANSAEYLRRSAHSGLLSLNGTAALLLNNTLGTSEADMATLFKNNPTGLQDMLDNSPSTWGIRFARSQQQGSEEAMDALSPEAKKQYSGLKYATLEQDKSAWRSPIRVLGDAIQSLPSSLAMGASIYLTRGAGKQATADALAAGLSPEAAKAAGVLAAQQTMSRVGAASEGAVGYAQQYSQSREDADKVPDATLASSEPYQRLIKDGYDPKVARILVSANAAEQAGQIAGIVDAAVNMVGGKFLGRVIGEGGAPLKAGAKGAATEAVTEGVQSAGEQFGQNWATKANLNPGQDLSEGVIESAMQGVAVGGFTGGAMSAMNARVGRHEQQELDAKVADQKAQVFETLQKTAEASKLLERSPDTLRSYMQDLADQGVPKVFVDSAALVKAGVDMQALAQALPSVAAQIDQVKTGGDFAIPTGELLTDSIGTTFAQQLIDHARTSEGSMSRAEAKVYMQEQGEQVHADIEKAFAEHDNDAEFKAGRDRVQAKLLEQLNTVNRFTPAVNQQYATLAANFYAVMAARSGMTVEQFADTYKLGVAGQAGAGAQVLDQNAQQGPTVSDALINLGKIDKTFQVPRSKATDMAAVAKDKSIKVAPVNRNSTDNSEWMLANTTPQGEGTQSWMVTLPGKRHATITQTGKSVYVNVSGVGEGNGGSKVYDLAANYALNNGLKFIGDPNGVSPAALRRRLENMLSSAVKYGTTDHLEPHADQLKDHTELGIPALKWTEGDTAGNMESMVKASLAATESSNPVGATLEYDPVSAHFKDGSGQPISGAESFRAYAGFDGRSQGAGQAGGATLQRNALYRALLSGPDARRAFLDSVRGQPSGASPGARATDGTFYQGKNLDQSARGQIAFGDDITKQASIISLLKGADLSTYIHESGHFFLEVQADLAARIAAKGEAVTPGEQSIVDDMNKVLAWMGVMGTPEMSPLGEWLAMPTEQKRPFHEQFARGFEAYAFEGKAPSLDLQKTFQTFRAWLVNVYRALLKSVNASKTDVAGALNVELSPEVRSVMDRMLATSDQIAEAEAARDMGPLFKTAEEAGMTAEEYKQYHDQGVQATMDAVDELQTKGLRDMQWLHNARSRKLKELQGKHDALRARVTGEVRKEVMAQPIYRAWSFLTAKTGEQIVPGVTPVMGIDATTYQGKLRTQVLRDMYGTADDAVWRKVSELRMTSDETGMHPDIVGELFGFSSGDELVRALTTAEPPQSVVEGMTDQRMLQEHGDLATPAGIERAADQAIHNEARSRFVATELGALQKAMSVREKVPGQRNTVDVLAKAAKDYASAVIAKLKVRDIRPGQYTAAEVRSSKAAAKAIGDIAQATLHKRNQLINMYAAKAAYEAQDEVKAAVEYFKKFDTMRKSVDPEYQDQIHALLERFDLRQGVTLKALDKRASLVEWVQSQVEQGMEPDIPPELLQEANRKSFKDMTVEEVRGLRDTIKQIEHLGRLKNKLLTAQANRNFAEAVDEIVTSIDKHAGDRQADTRTPNTLPALARIKLKNFWASHIKVATWARVMDGGKDGGPVWEYLVRTANVAGDKEVGMREKATKQLAKLVAPVLKEGRTGGKGMYFEGIPTAADKRAGKTGSSLNKEARLAVALNMGNASNTQRLLGGEGWTIQQIQPVLNTLTAADWTFVQAVWDHFESYRPMIAEKEKRVYGKEPAWIEPVPVQTPFGTLRGGYYPVKYDTRASERAESHADADAAKRMLAGAYTSATTRRSFTKARVDEVQGRPLLLSMDGIYNGVQEVIHDLTWHEWLIDANKLVRNKKIAGSMRDKYGPDVHQQFKKWLEDTAAGDRPAHGAGEVASAWVRQGVSVSGLGLNVMSAMMQPLGLTQSIVRIGPKWVGRGMAKAIGSPIDTVNEINEKSEFMRTRALTRLREINEVRSQVKGRTKAREAVDASAYFLMMRAQQLVDVPTWWGAYEKALAEGNDDARAVALSDQAVIDAQGSGGLKDQSGIEREGPGVKLFTTFYSFFNTALNLGVQKTMNNENKAKLAADYLLLYTVPAILGAALKDALTPGDSGDWDDPEKLLKKLIGEQISFLFGLLVYVREATPAMQALTGTTQYAGGYSGPAGLRLFPDAVKLGTQIKQGELDDGLRKAIINVAGELLRLPSAQVNRTINGIEALHDGKTENWGALLTGFQEPH